MEKEKKKEKRDPNPSDPHPTPTPDAPHARATSLRGDFGVFWNLGGLECF